MLYICIIFIRKPKHQLKPQIANAVQFVNVQYNAIYISKYAWMSHGSDI